MSSQNEYDSDDDIIIVEKKIPEITTTIKSVADLKLKKSLESLKEDTLCGPKSSKHVKAYTRTQLINMVVNNGLANPKNAKNMNMKQLCEALELPYTDPSGTKGKKIIFDDFEGCMALKKEELIIEHQKELEEKGITVEMARSINKDVLCDIIYKESDPITIPIDLKPNECYKYDVNTLRRIAINLRLDIARATTLKDFCDIISRHYARQKISFDTNINPDWKEYPNNEHPCLIPIVPEEELTMLEHQKRVVKHMLTHRALLAVHSTGSGKTLTAVSSIHCVLVKYPHIKVVVITPLSLVDNFKENVIKFGIDLEESVFKNRVEIKSYE